MNSIKLNEANIISYKSLDFMIGLLDFIINVRHMISIYTLTIMYVTAGASPL